MDTNDLAIVVVAVVALFAIVGIAVKALTQKPRVLDLRERLAPYGHHTRPVVDRGRLVAARRYEKALTGEEGAVYVSVGVLILIIVLVILLL